MIYYYIIIFFEWKKKFKNQENHLRWEKICKLRSENNNINNKLFKIFRKHLIKKILFF